MTFKRFKGESKTYNEVNTPKISTNLNRIRIGGASSIKIAHWNIRSTTHLL